MGTVLTHPFLCLNRYRQNDKMTYVACCHSATYSFTSKPEKGRPGADETCYCQPLYKRAALLRGSRWRQYGSLWLFMEPIPEHPSKWYSPSETVTALMKMYQELTEKQQLKISIYRFSRSTKCYQTATGTATRPATSYNIYKIKINA